MKCKDNLLIYTLIPTDEPIIIAPPNFPLPHSGPKIVINIFQHFIHSSVMILENPVVSLLPYAIHNNSKGHSSHSSLNTDTRSPIQHCILLCIPISTRIVLPTPVQHFLTTRVSFWTVPYLLCLSNVLIQSLRTTHKIKLDLGIESLCQTSLYQSTVGLHSLIAFHVDFNSVSTSCS